ncbi:synaptophysin-like protein 1 isoform X2 [Notamacropus eugenii]|uniref:synaptophysin-like protein 1 isoform X2 n=2 Tax=Notamacropus eugenii TaxID=9315 RepID=UPI003B68602D
MASNMSYRVRQRISRLGQRMSGLQINFSPLKEPLGFIKILQWNNIRIVLVGKSHFSLIPDRKTVDTCRCSTRVLFKKGPLGMVASIFSFATCGGFKGKTSFKVSCSAPNPANGTVEAAFAYPFRLNQVSFHALQESLCGEKWSTYFLIGDFSSSAQFYVTFAVLVFLYCIAALVLYIGYMNLYRESRKIPFIDFLITLIATFLWLVSTSAWAKALTDIKMTTGENLIGQIALCNNKDINCSFDSVTSMGSLNVSVIFGFLNMILWGGNAWFVYKETSLHSQSNISTHGAGTVAPPTGM